MTPNSGPIQTAVIFLPKAEASPQGGWDVLSGRIGGLTLLERSVLSSRKAGVRRWFVLGIPAEALAKIRVRLGPDEEIISPPPSESGALLRKFLAEEEGFFLMAADCVFEPKAIQELGKKRELLKVHSIVAALPGGFSSQSGESVPGLFLCERSFEETLFQSLSEAPKGSIEAILKEWRASGKIGECGVEGALLHDARTPEGREKAEKALYRALVKKTDGFMATHINRPISLFITRFLVRTNLTPNGATLLNLGIGLLGAGFFAVGDYTSVLVGALLFQLSSITDGCDGEIARLKFMESRFGGWLDIVCDNLTHVAVFGGIALGAYRLDPVPHWIYLGGLAVLGTFMSFLLVAIQLYRKESGAGPFFTSVREGAAQAGKNVDGITNLQDSLARRDFTYLLLLFALFGFAEYFLALTAVGSNIFWILLLYTLKK